MLRRRHFQWSLPALRFEIFQSFNNNSIFKDKSPLQNSYQPEDIPHRSEQITQVASILAPVLRGENQVIFFFMENREQENFDYTIC